MPIDWTNVASSVITIGGFTAIGSYLKLISNTVTSSVEAKITASEKVADAKMFALRQSIEENFNRQMVEFRQFMEISIERKLLEAMDSQKVWMNGKYLASREQERENRHFNDRMDSHERRLDTYSERLHDMETSPACERVLPVCDTRMSNIESDNRKIRLDQGTIQDRYLRGSQSSAAGA